MSATDTRIGVEVELHPPASYSSHGILSRCYSDGTAPNRWAVGTDGINNEFRTEGTVSLGEFTEHVGDLANWIEAEYVPRFGSPVFNRTTGFHVHVNNDEYMGDFVPRQNFLVAYYYAATESRSLCEDEVARTGEGCYNSPAQLASMFRFKQTHGAEIRMNGLGTCEIRIWDATFDMDLIARRQQFLERLVEQALNPTEDLVAEAEQYATECPHPHWDRSEWESLFTTRINLARRGSDAVSTW